MTDDQTRPAIDPSRWLESHGDYLYRYALFRISDPNVAEEMVQETFVAALKSKESFSGRSSERTWLVGILKHKVIDHLRRVYRERGLMDELEQESASDPEFGRLGNWVEGPRKWEIHPDEVINQKQFWETLQKCLENMPEDTARAYVMREVDGLSSEEICKVLSISANNLWVRLHRARTKLRRCLEKNWFDPK